MQITIVQSDIETAIENYIASIIQIKEGMQIDIDLAATRGPEGFKATINIVPEGTAKKAPVATTAPAPEPVVEEVAKPAPVKVKASGTKPLNIAAKVAEAAQAKLEPVEEPVTEEVAETPVTEEADAEEQPVEEPAVVEAEADTVEEKTAAANAEEAPRKSLFAGLGKTTN